MTILLAVLSLLAQSAGAQAPQPGRKLVTYNCSGFVQLSGPGRQSVSITKTFLEDGSVLNQNVELYEDSDFILGRAPNERISATLKWPGDHRFRRTPEPFSWDDGSIRFSLFNQDPGMRPQRREVWEQTVVYRDDRAWIYEHDGVRSLLSERMGVMLASPLNPPTGPGFTAGIDDLLAWGHGVARLTLFHLNVERQRYRRNSYPNDGVGRQRITGQYQLDMAGFARRVAEVREAATGWERGLGDFHACRRQIEHPDQQIVVTDGRIARPNR